MMKRSFDLLASLTGIVLLSPLLLLLALLILAGSGWPVFYRQWRVGRHGKDFRLIKFRTMKNRADQQGLLTVSDRDPRITGIGAFLRRYKLDELPQLLNVMVGDMSLVGPRPEVRRYVDLYTEEQKRVLNVRPGITDPASILYAEENKLLSAAENPEAHYIKVIMPEKLRINLNYISERSFGRDLAILFRTVARILG